MYTMWGQAIRQLREAGEPDGFVQRRGPLHQKIESCQALPSPITPRITWERRTTPPSGRVPAGAVRAGGRGNAPNVMAVRTTTFPPAHAERAARACQTQVLYYWRVHEGSTSGGTDAKPYVAKVRKKALADHLERTGCTANS